MGSQAWASYDRLCPQKVFMSEMEVDWKNAGSMPDREIQAAKHSLKVQAPTCESACQAAYTACTQNKPLSHLEQAAAAQCMQQHDICKASCSGQGP